MPRPRFYKLPAQKQELILQAAAREFAAHGYEDAALNRILEDAQLSKGAAYYYFDDKADLFAATVQHYASDLIGGLDDNLDELTAATFWPVFIERYVTQFEMFQDRPWAFGAIKAAGRLSMNEIAPHPLLADALNAVLYGVRTLLVRGQALGVVRTDLPEGLLIALLIGVDDASDRWLLANWDDLGSDGLLRTARHVADGLRRLLEP